jgi:hypothetical protein
MLLFTVMAQFDSLHPYFWIIFPILIFDQQLALADGTLANVMQAKAWKGCARHLTLSCCTLELSHQRVKKPGQTYPDRCTEQTENFAAELPLDQPDTRVRSA